MVFVIYSTTGRQMNLFFILFSLYIKHIAFLAFYSFQTNVENNTILFKKYCNSLHGRPTTFAQKMRLYLRVRQLFSLIGSPTKLSLLACILIEWPLFSNWFPKESKHLTIQI